MNGAKLAGRKPVRMMIAGYPGSAKTGSLVSLLNAGYKLRILDYDGNIEPLLQYTNPDMLHNLDVVHLEDKMRQGLKFMEPIAAPAAYVNGLRLIDHWKYKEPDGTEIDLGKPREWGCDTVMVLDSNTRMGDAAMLRAEGLMNRTPMNRTDSLWGFAMNLQDAFLKYITSSSHPFHVIVITHLKMISPKDFRKGDSDLTQKLKEQVADLVPTRLYPRALGQALSPEIGGLVPIIYQALNKEIPGEKVKQILTAVPRPELDLKVPANLPKELPIETGLLEIFKALAPPLSECQPKGTS